MPLIVSYIRVSTRQQDESGLGQEAQEAAVSYYARCNGAEIIETFREVESGRNSDRPQLAAAILRCRQTGATLVVAKLDRLARNVGFLSTLMDSQVQFVACDNPQANRLTIQILAIMAENEAMMTSQRTKAALAAYKARGGKLGATLPQCRNLTPDAARSGARASAKAKTEKADTYYRNLMPMIQELKPDRSGKAIADELNARHITNAFGRPWTEQQVYRVLSRYDRVLAESD